MNKTKISWCDTVWNPTTGCTKISTGCKNCYAESIAKRFWGKRTFSEVQLCPERLKQPYGWKKPQKIFVNSMSDLFHVEVPFSFITTVLNVVQNCPQHTFIILTKRPERMREYFNEQPNYIRWDNLWLGVSVENQEMADKRIPLLLDTPAEHRFLSIEPLLGKIDLKRIAMPDGQNYINCLTETDDGYFYQVHNKIDWVICGCESGRNRRHVEQLWIELIRNDSVGYEVPFFLKQMEVNGEVIKEPFLKDVQYLAFPESMTNA